MAKIVSIMSLVAIAGGCGFTVWTLMKSNVLNTYFINYNIY